MTVQELIAALKIPASSRVDQRIPKKLLVENGAPTAADRRAITEGIEEIHWIATLKPSTIGVPEYRDEAREYLEIAILHIALRQDAKAARIAELTHRAVPYPLVLLLSQQDKLSLSMAHIRWAQNEVGKVVLGDDPVAVTLNESKVVPSVLSAFLEALPLAHQPRENLMVLYQGWLDTLATFQAAQVTGTFSKSQTDEQAAARRASLFAWRELEQQIAILRAAAAKEKQLARQVALNLEIKQLQTKQQQAMSKL